MQKSKGITFILCTFLGMLGVHRMYLGKLGTGAMQAVLTITVVGALISGPWVLLDWIVILSGGFKDSSGRKLV